jgi:predicted exporter
MAAIQGSVLTSSVDGLLKMIAASALLVHVLAAFTLCWAARPIAERPSSVRGLSFVDAYRHADDTFRNYRRGWRMTLLALAVSAAAAALFVLHALGVVVPGAP